MNKRLNFIGGVFLIWGFAAIIDNVSNVETGIAPLMWMSYICLIVMSIGILKRDSGLIASQVVLIAIPYILWNIDLIQHLITGNGLFGITDYIFVKGQITEKAIALQHVFNIPLSVYSIYLIGLKKSGFWKISIFQITLVFIITRLTTNYEQNVNCVFRNCANFSFGLPYILEWFLAYIAMILITTWFLNKSFKNKEEKIK